MSTPMRVDIHTHFLTTVLASALREREELPRIVERDGREFEPGLDTPDRLSRLQAQSQPSSFWRIVRSQATDVTCPQVACSTTRGSPSMRRHLGVDAIPVVASTAANESLCDRGGSHE